MTLIAIGSKMRVGKDTAGAALVRDCGYHRLSFAEPLRKLLMLTDPMVYPANAAVNLAPNNRVTHLVKGTDGWESAKSRWPEIRRLLQNLGVGCREVFGEDCWVNLALAEAAKHKDVVITDLRFTNEAEAVKKAGGFLVRIDRPGQMPGGHISENDLDDWPEKDWDAVLKNDGSVIELEQQIVQFVRGLERKKRK